MMQMYKIDVYYTYLFYTMRCWQDALIYTIIGVLNFFTHCVNFTSYF